MAKFVVNRSKWCRGNRIDSRLLRTDGLRCCIGFVGQQCGIPDNALLHPAIADVQSTYRNHWPAWLTDIHNANIAYKINDNPGIYDENRESQLKALFAEHGDEIEFVN